MKQKINNLMNQLSENELEDLFVHIKRQYAVEEKDSMLRDDIRDNYKSIIQKVKTTLELIPAEYINTPFLDSLEKLITFSLSSFRTFIITTNMSNLNIHSSSMNNINTKIASILIYLPKKPDARWSLSRK